MRVYWADVDDSRLRDYIESTYLIRSKEKTEDAKLLFLDSRGTNPIAEYIDGVAWDGKPRCKYFFSKYAGASDTDYTREVSRIFFAQAVDRLYNPGCQADHVLTLVGKQGDGKSKMARWLAVFDDYYASVTTIKGKEGFEAVQGKWICELEELMAIITSGGKHLEAEARTKQFISTRSDYYRQPYMHHPGDVHRSCVFIGTTNREEFLTDPTGNRRWYPVKVKIDSYWMEDHREEIQREILQCYAEACYHLRAKDQDSKPYPSRKYVKDIEDQQEAFEYEDGRRELIERYLVQTKLEYTCCLDIWQNVLHPHSPHLRNEMPRTVANEIGEILVHKIGCTRSGTKAFYDQAGNLRFKAKAFKVPCDLEERLKK